MQFNFDAWQWRGLAIDVQSQSPAANCEWPWVRTCDILISKKEESIEACNDKTIHLVDQWSGQTIIIFGHSGASVGTHQLQTSKDQWLTWRRQSFHELTKFLQPQKECWLWISHPLIRKSHQKAQSSEQSIQVSHCLMLLSFSSTSC